MLYIKNIAFIMLCAQPGHSAQTLKQWFGHQDESRNIANNQASHTIPHTMPVDDTKELMPQTSDPCMEEHENEYHVISDNGSDIEDNTTDYVPSISLYNERCDPGTIYICGVPDRLSIIPAKYAENTNGQVITFENIVFSDQKKAVIPRDLIVGNVYVGPQSAILTLKNCHFIQIVTHDTLQTITLDRQTLNQTMPNDVARDRYHQACKAFQTKRHFIERILTEEQCNGVKCLLDGQKNHRWFWHQSKPDEWCFQRFNPQETTCISSLGQYETIPVCSGVKLYGVTSAPFSGQHYIDNIMCDFMPGNIDLKHKAIPELILELCHFQSLINGTNTEKLTLKKCVFDHFSTHRNLHTIIMDTETLHTFMHADDVFSEDANELINTNLCNDIRRLLEDNHTNNPLWFWHHPSQTDEWCFQRFNQHGITCISSLDQYNAIPLCAGIKMVNIKNTHHDTLDHLHNGQSDSVIAPPLDLRNKKIHTLILEQCQFSALVNSQNIATLTIDDDTLNSLFPFGPIILCSNVPGYDQMVKERMNTIKKGQWSKLRKILEHNTSSPWEWHYNGAKKHTVFFPKKTQDCPDSEGSDSSDNSSNDM